MRMFTGFASRRNLTRIAGTSALGAAALAAFSIAEPAASADLYDRYGERYEYRTPAAPRPRYGEYYEYRVPAAPEHYGEPREYRVVIYPVKPRYESRGYPAPAYPPRRYGEQHDEYEYAPAGIERRYGPRPVYSEARVERRYEPRYVDTPYEPYGRALEPEPLLPPAPVGPPQRW